MKRMWSKNELKEVVKNTQKDITTLVDSQGHERFIEGDITCEEITGLTQSYGKWSLSGTHLMMVIAGSIVNTTAIAWGTKLANVNLPEWVVNKIVPIIDTYVDIKGFKLYSSGLGEQNFNALLRKISDVISIGMTNITLNDDRSFRIQFDLLIDND